LYSAQKELLSILNKNNKKQNSTEKIEVKYFNEKNMLF